MLGICRALPPSIKNKIILKANEKVKELGYNPDDFKINITTDN